MKSEYYMKYLKQSFLFLLIGLIASSVSHAAEQLNVQGFSDDTRLPITVLKKIINQDKTYRLNFPDDAHRTLSSETKLHADVQNNDIDIIWTLTSKQHEEKFRAIYIPLYKGMLGMRIAIVKQENKNLFSNISNLDQLRAFKAGQGSLWADTKILEHNELTVVKELKYNNLFPMLEGERFDYFPRGIPEPWAEIDRESEYNLVVEPHLLIKYTAPFYFFVNKENRQLAHYLTEKLNALITSGEYEEIFNSHTEIQDAIQLANLGNRVIINLENPGLTAQTPIERKELWFNN